jgi:hypothetical protein
VSPADFEPTAQELAQARACIAGLPAGTPAERNAVRARMAIFVADEVERIVAALQGGYGDVAAGAVRRARAADAACAELCGGTTARRRAATPATREAVAA